MSRAQMHIDVLNAEKRMLGRIPGHWVAPRIPGEEPAGELGGTLSQCAAGKHGSQCAGSILWKLWTVERKAAATTPNALAWRAQNSAHLAKCHPFCSAPMFKRMPASCKEDHDSPRAPDVEGLAV